MRSIPFFNYPDIYLSEREQFLKIFDDVCSRGAFILQEELVEFENELARFAGVKHALGIGNATDGLLLLYLVAGIQSGDEVLFCSHTMTATVAPLSILSATPVPVEVGFDRTIDVNDLRSRVTERTRCIVPTQLNGRVSDMDAILKIAEENNLIVIEDSAQALGARYNGSAAGSFGIGGVISFYPAKSLGCFGDGGAILTNDTEVFEQLALLRDHGRTSKESTSCWGYNTRLDNLQAAFLSHKLKSFHAVIRHRREIASRYDERLSQIEFLDLPQPPSEDVNFDTFQNYEVRAKNRNALQSHLKENGVGTIVQWGGRAVHQIPGLTIAAQLPNTEHFFSECLLLPMNSSLSTNDVDYICDVIEMFYEKAGQ